LELAGAADLPAVCVWPKPDREDAGFHFERSRNLGTAAAAGIESRDCDASVRVRSTDLSVLQLQQKVVRSGDPTRPA